VSECPHICNEPDSEGDYLCTAPRIFGDSRHADDRCSTPCTTVDADDCLIYQRARAKAAEAEVARLTTELERTRKVAERLAEVVRPLAEHHQSDAYKAHAAFAAAATLNPKESPCQNSKE